MGVKVLNRETAELRLRPLAAFHIYADETDLHGETTKPGD